MKTMVEEIEARVARAGTDPVWGYNHCQRVYAVADELGRSEQLSYDSELLYIASLLHDIGLYKAYSMRKGSDHAQRSSSAAEQILRDGDYPAQGIQVVLDAIENHQPGAFSGVSVESVLLKDAVVMDYLGAIGIARALAMAGVEEDVPDLAAAFRRSEEQHRNLPGYLILESSKKMARERMEEKERFMESLSAATDGLKLL